MPRKPFQGPTLFSYGFRAFFLFASLFALIVIPVWMGVLTGIISLASYFDPTVWHIHEMLFGYTAAVIAGFLFTAIPNWTGRMPIQGWPLALLVVLWGLGRLATAGLLGIGPPLVAMIDSAFLGAIVVMVSIEIMAGKNWRNIKVLIPVTILFLANIAFHVEALTTGFADYATRLGFAAILFLVMLIGGRVIPSFTRNWLVKQGNGPLPIPFNKFDAVSILFAVLSLAAWVFFPENPVVGGALAAAAALHLIRLFRWQGVRTIPSPLLFMLHIAYAFIPAGILLLGLAGLNDSFNTYTPGLHLLGIGAIGGITVAVMMRATLGHTGRDLVAPKVLILAFNLIIFAGLIRSFFSDTVLWGYNGIEVAATLWTLGFALFVVKVGTWLVTPKQQKRAPNPTQR